MSADQALIDAIRADLAAAGDTARAAGQQRYMKSALPYYGITSPDLKRLLRPHLRSWQPADRETWEATVRELWDTVTHREEWYAAIALVRHRAARQWLDPAALDLTRHLVSTGGWWDVVDELAQHVLGAVLLGDRDQVTPVVHAWARDDDLWIRRSAVISQNRHRADTDTALLAETIEANLSDASFWLRKAIGWALREHSYVDPAWVVRFVDSHELSPLSRREALKRLR